MPAYLYDLNLGDRVTVVRSADGPFVATGIAHDAGNDTYRFYLLSADDKTAWYPLARESAIMGCLIDVVLNVVLNATRRAGRRRAGDVVKINVK